MGIQIANNATSVLAVGIGTGDVTITVSTGDGARFPVLGAGDYFFAAIENTLAQYEIVKVTARVGDAMTVVRAQEGTTALSFSAGALFDLRMTKQTFYDYILSLIGSAAVDQFTTVAGQAVYGPLTYAPTDIQQVIVVQGGAVQRPTTDYTVSGTDLTLIPTPTVSGIPVTVFSFNPTSVRAGMLLAANNLSDVANAATARTNLGLAIGVNVQAYDAATAKTNAAQNFTAPQRSALLTDNDGSFDLSANQNFKCTPTGSTTLTFTNQADGLSGSVVLINSSNYTVSAHANTKISAAALSRISATGTYRIDYVSDGTNAYCTASENLA